MDEIVSHDNMQIRTTILKQTKNYLGYFPAELFVATPAVPAELILPIICRTWESESPSEWKKRMIAKIPKSATIVEIVPCPLKSHKL